jgi:ketosteroid isomerase-like protein
MRSGGQAVSKAKPENVRIPRRSQPSKRQFRLALRYPGAAALLARLALLVPARCWPRRNVDVVLTLQSPATEDFAQLLRDDNAWAALAKGTEPLFQPDFETVAPGVPGTEKSYTGLDGLRAAWLEWVAPWASYRSETKEAIDAGDRVLVIVNDFGRREGSTEEVKVDGAAVWSLRDGKIARFEAYTHRSEAREAIGLEG